MIHTDTVAQAGVATQPVTAFEPAEVGHGKQYVAGVWVTAPAHAEIVDKWNAHPKNDGAVVVLGPGSKLRIETTAVR